MAEETAPTENQILSEIPTYQPKNWKLIGSVLTVIVIVVLLGVVSAILFWNQRYSPGNVKSSAQTIATTQPPEPQKDERTFRDQAEGTLERNETTGQYQQGTHKLVRAGSPSQTVYLVSSVVDLEQHVGQKVKVWGETFQSNQVGWLMDVGKVEKGE